MKRSEAITKLLPKVVSKKSIIRKEFYDNGWYHQQAEELLTFIENELGMKPPGYWDSELWDKRTNCWEPEDV